MAIDVKTTQHIAHLARIQLLPEELESETQQLNQILAILSEIDQVDTQGVEPMAHPLHLQQRLRDDVVTELNQRDVLQSIAPDAELGLYLVPKVIEG